MASRSLFPLMDTSSTALFETYEQDFNQLIESTRDKLEGSGKDEVGGASVHPITQSLYRGSLQNSARPLLGE